MEFPATGGAISTSAFQTVKLIRYVTVMDYVILACECIFVLFSIYYAIEEILEVRLAVIASGLTHCPDPQSGLTYLSLMSPDQGTQAEVLH